MNQNARKLLKILILLLILFAIELCYIHYKNIIIRVDGRNITKTQFDKIFNEKTNDPRFFMLGIDIKKNKKSFLYLTVKDDVVVDLIKQTLIDEEIEKKHIKVDDKELNMVLEDIIKSSGSKENFNEMLKQNETSFTQFKENVRRDLKKKKLASSISKIVISNEEEKKFYKENLNMFKHDATANVSHIFIAANSQQITQEIKSNPENKNLNEQEIQAKVKHEQQIRLEKAKKLLIILKNNPDLFAKLAKENSDDKTSAKNGGNLGVVAGHQMSPTIAKIVFSIKLNEISGIIKTPRGYHILVVSDRTNDYQDSFETAKNNIHFILEKEKCNAVLDNLANQLKIQAKITFINPDFAPKSIEEKYSMSENIKI